ncbi:MAG: hypothetical protein JNK37_17890 [Verrucomicrobiales bacterium]|nr:hypothetical protein [Verrucomicrobiales bacterium]
MNLSLRPRFALWACCVLMTMPAAQSADTSPSSFELAPKPSPGQGRPADPALIRAVPIQDYWNAHAWDPIGGSIFWHDLSEKRRAEMSARHAKSRGQAPASPKARPAAAPESR